MQIAETGTLSHTVADADDKAQWSELALPKRRRLRMMSYRLFHHRIWRHLSLVGTC